MGCAVRGDVDGDDDVFGITVGGIVGVASVVDVGGVVSIVHIVVVDVVVDVVGVVV